MDMRSDKYNDVCVYKCMCGVRGTRKCLILREDGLCMGILGFSLTAECFLGEFIWVCKCVRKPNRLNILFAVGSSRKMS